VYSIERASNTIFIVFSKLVKDSPKIVPFTANTSMFFAFIFNCYKPANPCAGLLGKRMSTTHTIVFSEEVFAFVMDYGSSYIKLRKHWNYIYEVIGNIYENK